MKAHVKGLDQRSCTFGFHWIQPAAFYSWFRPLRQEDLPSEGGIRRTPALDCDSSCQRNRMPVRREHCLSHCSPAYLPLLPITPQHRSAGCLRSSPSERLELRPRQVLGRFVRTAC